MQYGQSQWFLFFFTYSFLGWIWESLYVSAKKRQWINRGFLYGPWLPIYGFGTIIILFLTLPVRENMICIFLLGMTGATILEYVTGDIMERLFHVRYWDYSNQPLNVNGHICLGVSLAWGVFSILLVHFLHSPVERLVLVIPSRSAEALSMLLAVLFAVDTTKSVQSALDLKSLLNSMSASSQHLAGVEQRLRQAIEQFEQNSDTFRQKIRRLEENAAHNQDHREQARELQKESRSAYLLRLLNQRRMAKSHLLSTLTEKINVAMETVHSELNQNISDGERSRLENTQQILFGLQAALHKAEMEDAARRDRDYQRAVSMLYRNPTAASRQNREAFRELLTLKKDQTNRKENS